MFKNPDNFRCTRAVIWVLPLLLSACASQPQEPEPVAPEPETAQVEPPPAVEMIPDREFEADTLYALLVAEIAGSRNRYDIAVSNYVHQALATRDPGVTARAARIARLLNAHDAALEMAMLWIELDPDNSEAHFIAGAELARVGKLTAAAEHSAVLLEQGEEGFFEAVAASAAQADDEGTVIELQERYLKLLQEHPDNASLHLGLSLLQFYTGELEPALASARRAAELDSSNPQAALQETRVLQEMGRTEQALEKLARLVDTYPENQRLRLQYARILASTDLAKAQQEFATLVEQSPGDPDFVFSLALIQLERGLLVEAAEQFRSLTNGGEHSNSAHYYLGQIAASRGDPDAALHHYRQVDEGAEYLPAVMQVAQLLLQQESMFEALDYLREERRTASQNVQDNLYLLEAELLSDAGEHTEALTALNDGLRNFPESSELLYGRAMLFTFQDRIDLAEQDLKQIIALDPNNVAALNALGYTLADRTDRLEEAYGYIQQALAMEPNDAAILDSMGWVNFRLGNHREALTYLRKAIAMTPDHEIASHLGEVLWVTGAKEEAQQVWQEGLQLNPSSHVIRETLNRLNVDLDEQ